MLRKLFLISLVGLLGGVIYVLLPHTTTTIRYFEATDEEMLSISRPRFPIPREFIFGGIWPFSGRIAPDPHFERSDLMHYANPESGIDFRYQSFDVNPWFKNPALKESVLVIDTSLGQYEYAIDGFKNYNFGRGAKGFVVLSKLNQSLVMYSSNLSSGSGWGFLIIDLPFGERTPTIVMPEDEAAQAELIREILEAGPNPETLVQLCNAKNNIDPELGVILSGGMCEQ